MGFTVKQVKKFLFDHPVAVTDSDLALSNIEASADQSGFVGAVIVRDSIGQVNMNLLSELVSTPDYLALLDIGPLAGGRGK